MHCHTQDILGLARRISLVCNHTHGKVISQMWIWNKQMKFISHRMGTCRKLIDQTCIKKYGVFSMASIAFFIANNFYLSTCLTNIYIYINKSTTNNDVHSKIWWQSFHCYLEECGILLSNGEFRSICNLHFHVSNFCFLLGPN